MNAIKKIAKTLDLHYVEATTSKNNVVMIVARTKDAARDAVKAIQSKPRQGKPFRRVPLSAVPLNDDFFLQDPSKMFDVGVKGLPENVKKAVLLWIKKNGTVKISSTKDRVVFTKTFDAPQSRVDAVWKLQPKTWSAFMGNGGSLTWIKPRAVKGSPLDIVLSKKIF